MPLTTFRLASVLAYREALLDEAAQEVARIEGQLHDLEGGLAQVRERRGATLAGPFAASALSGSQLHQAVEYLDSLDRLERQLQAEIQQAERRLEAARATLLERHRAVSALKRLQEQQETSARLEAARSEQRTLDEIAGLQAERRRRKA